MCKITDLFANSKQYIIFYRSQARNNYVWKVFHNVQAKLCPKFESFVTEFGLCAFDP